MGNTVDTIINICDQIISTIDEFFDQINYSPDDS